MNVEILCKSTKNTLSKSNICCSKMTLDVLYPTTVSVNGDGPPIKHVYGGENRHKLNREQRSIGRQYELGIEHILHHIERS